MQKFKELLLKLQLVGNTQIEFKLHNILLFIAFIISLVFHLHQSDKIDALKNTIVVKDMAIEHNYRICKEFLPASFQEGSLAD